MSTEKQMDPLQEGCTRLATEADLSDGSRELKASMHALRGDIRGLERSLKFWLVAAAIVQGVLNALIRHVVLSGAWLKPGWQGVSTCSLAFLRFEKLIGVPLPA